MIDPMDLEGPGQKAEDRRRIEASRREVEERIAALTGSIEREVGWLPKGKGLLLLVAAAAGGFALATGRKRRKEKKAVQAASEAASSADPGKTGRRAKKPGAGGPKR